MYFVLINLICIVFLTIIIYFHSLISNYYDLGAHIGKFGWSVEKKKKS